jgi:alkanesulfonate monooxygenase SsuD/methylene tetrahydromethanopterin reductase-like flavin-dependent oxidoreductase (luciferase family)
MRSIVLRFDMRAAPFAPDTAAERYLACVEMAARADELPVDVVGLSEHHVSPDGFLSSPLILASQIAARTARVRISVSALLVPLHEPLRLAEDIAVLDLLSGGRFSATAGLGYREIEYRALGADWERRGRLFDEKLSTMLAAWTGQPFDYRGEELKLNPVPLRPAYQLLNIGGNSAAAARRAANFGLLFCPAIDDPALAECYVQACAAKGFTQGFVIMPRHPATVVLADDPEQAWDALGAYLLFDARAYGAWSHPSRRAYAESSAATLEQLREEGKYRILSPAQALQQLEETGSLHLAPLCGGMPLAAGRRCMQLFAEQVAPELRTM